MIRRLLIYVILLLCSISFAGSADAVVYLTVYNQNLGLVREIRSTDLVEGLNVISVTDVARQLDTTSVHFKPLDIPDMVLLEQNFDYDLLSSAKLLSKFLGETIELDFGEGKSKPAKLLSVSDGMIVEMDGKVHLNPGGRIILPEVKGGLLLRPTLVWKVNSPQAGTSKYEISYLTNGINWIADYVYLLNATDTKADLEGWVTINNESGATYSDANLKLIAGEIHRAPSPAPAYREEMAMKAADGMGAGFEEKAFFEYHMYTLPRKTDIKDNQVKQIALFPTAYDVPTKKVYTTTGDRKVQVKVEFQNDKKSGLGIPLPKGRVRVFKRDEADGTPQFIGEDQIDHTPKDEKIRLYVGDAFDIIAEKTQTDYKDLGRGYKASYEVKVKNHKTEKIEVIYSDRVWGEWEIVNETLKHRKVDAWTMEWAIPVPADGETTLKYTVIVTWR